MLIKLIAVKGHESKTFVHYQQLDSNLGEAEQKAKAKTIGT
jgi:hypothetical protein